MQEILIIVIIGILAFIGFCIYFIFKILEFVIRATNLYEKIITREDVIIQLLIDIRDSNKSVDADNWIESPAEDYEEDVSDDFYEKEFDEKESDELDEAQQEYEKQEDEKDLEIKKEELKNEETYDAMREKIVRELDSELKEDQEITILKSMSRLPYSDLKNLEFNPKDLSDTGAKVLRLILDKIEQHKKFIDKSGT